MYGLHDGKEPYSEKIPWKPHSRFWVQSGPIASGLKLKTLWLTSTFWVFHRQSPYSGALLIWLLRQDCTVAASGATSVQAPVLVFAGEPQNRLEFSQRITPPQLSMNLLPV